MTCDSSFLGFYRPDGRVGIRNYLLILSLTGLTAPTARRIGMVLPNARVVAPPFGSGIIGRDEVMRERLLLGFARNPNVGAVLLIGAKSTEVEKFSEAIRLFEKSCESLILDDCGNDAITLTERGIRAAAHLTRNMSYQRRKSAPVSELFLATQCGRSDPSSGIIANPLIGSVLDHLVDLGGRAVVGESLEWFGAEDLLAKRAITTDVANQIRRVVSRRVQLATECGMDLLGNNPGPTNIAAGLSTLEEKALGGIGKTGSRTIQGVLDHGLAPENAGLWLMDQPWYSPEALSGMVAAGAQISLFSTGAGNSFVSLLAPTVKISANPITCATLSEQIDMRLDDVFLGHKAPGAAFEDLWQHLIETASGLLTFGEILNEGEEVQSRLGESL